MTTAEPVVYKITDGDDDCFENFVVFAPEVLKWVVKCDLHPGFRALLEKGGDWRPVEDPADEMVLFDNAEEAIAAAVRKHDEEGLDCEGGGRKRNERICQGRSE